MVSMPTTYQLINHSLSDLESCFAWDVIWHKFEAENQKDFVIWIWLFCNLGPGYQVQNQMLLSPTSPRTIP